MVLASSYVIERIYRALEEEASEGQDVFEKFSQRYPEDLTLIRIYDNFKNKSASQNPEGIAEVKKSLEQLKNFRELRTNGGIDRCYIWYLWYKNRRT